MTTKGITRLTITLLVALVLISVVVISYFLIRFIADSDKSQRLSQTAETNEWKSYQHPKYGYTFLYPSNWSIQDSQNFGNDNINILNLNQKIMFSIQAMPALGIGCTYIPAITPIDVYIGGTRLHLKDACGLKKYIVEGITKSGKRVWVTMSYFLNTPEENAIRDSLKSVTGFQPIQP